jgi:hypothetical protein
MINLQDTLRILYYNGTSYVDYSTALSQVKGSQSATVELSTTSFLYVGYRKPLKNISLVVSTVSIISSVLSVSLLGNSNLNITDETQNLTRSGNLFWTNPLPAYTYTLENETLHWYKIASSVATSAITLQSVSRFFCDYVDVIAIMPALADINLFGSSTDIYNIIELSKENILQKLTNAGKLTQQSFVSIFDFSDVYELNKASAYDVVSQICLLLSDNENDKYEKLAKNYEKKSTEFLNTYYLSFDNSTDILNKSTIKQVKTGRLMR